jgi:hypothetical protein
VVVKHARSLASGSIGLVLKKSKAALGVYIRIYLCEDIPDTLDDAVTDQVMTA